MNEEQSEKVILGFVFVSQSTDCGTAGAGTDCEMAGCKDRT